MTFFEPLKRPQVWFFKTINETSGDIPRAVALPVQWIPVNNQGDFEHVEEELYVSADHDLRSANPIGTVFATLRFRKAYAKNNPANKAFYQAKPPVGSEIFILTGPNKNASPEIMDAYSDLLAGKLPRLHMAPAIQFNAPPKPKSMIEGLLKEHPYPTPATHGFYVEPVIWERLIFNFHKDNASLLIGPEGSGKSELADLVAQSFGRPAKTFNMGAKLDPVASLIGVHRHQTSKEGSFFDRADFTYAIEGPNAIILEELSRAPSTANNILFQLFEKTRSLTLDTATGLEDRTIPVHAECRFLATANEGYQFTGTTALDPALKRRFKIIRIHYMPEEEEVRILSLRTQADRKDCETIVRVASELRELYSKNELTVGASTSATIDAAEMTYAGFEMYTTLELAFLHLYREEEQDIVRDILQAR